VPFTHCWLQFQLKGWKTLAWCLREAGLAPQFFVWITVFTFSFYLFFLITVITHKLLQTIEPNCSFSFTLKNYVLKKVINHVKECHSFLWRKYHFVWCHWNCSICKDEKFLFSVLVFDAGVFPLSVFWVTVCVISVRVVHSVWLSLF